MFALLWTLQNEIRIRLVIYWLCMTTLTVMYFYALESTVCTKVIILCLLIAFTFVGSLYVWKHQHFRDHPKTISRRFISVTFATFISSLYVILFTSWTENDVSEILNIAHTLGIRYEGILQAASVPLFLTMILFLGPLMTRFIDDGIWFYTGNKHLYKISFLIDSRIFGVGMSEASTHSRYWNSSFRNLIWLRNHIMAPFSEEFSFRACMLPLLVKCYSDEVSVFVCPVFFGIAHAHHLIERLRYGDNIGSAIIETIFQFAYTTVFGAYSAFLFLRTGHFVAPLIVHSFCNHMGFPEFGEIMTYSQPKKGFIIISYFVGLVMWIYLLFPLTHPSIYKNNIFWQ